MFLGVLLAGIVTTTWLWREASILAEKAKEQERIAKEQAKRADREAAAAIKYASDLRATLNELQTELIHRALGEALAGDLDAIGQSLERAKLAKLTDERPEVVETLRGLAQLNAGKIQDAISSLESALLMNPDDLGALAVSFWVHQNAGDYGNATHFILKVYELQARGIQPRDDYEQLLIAQFRVFALDESGLRKLITRLDDIIARRGKWGLAYSARSDAKRELAKRFKRLEVAEAARTDAAQAMRYQPENPTVITSGLYATLVTLEMPEAQNAVDGARVNALRDEGMQLADQLQPWQTHFHAQGIRVAFYWHVGETGKADAIRLAMVANIGHRAHRQTPCSPNFLSAANRRAS